MNELEEILWQFFDRNSDIDSKQVLKAMEKAYRKGWEDATSEAIKEIHENYRPNE